MIGVNLFIPFNILYRPALKSAQDVHNSIPGDGVMIQIVLFDGLSPPVRIAFELSCFISVEAADVAGGRVSAAFADLFPVHQIRQFYEDCVHGPGHRFIQCPGDSS